MLPTFADLFQVWMETLAKVQIIEIERRRADGTVYQIVYNGATWLVALEELPSEEVRGGD